MLAVRYDLVGGVLLDGLEVRQQEVNVGVDLLVLDQEVFGFLQDFVASDYFLVGHYCAQGELHVLAAEVLGFFVD